MPEPAQRDYRTTELDPDLLSTPFRVQTNWHVITGAACSGKTTLIDQLADKGFRTVPEVARVYIHREMAKGRTRDEILGNAAALQRGWVDLQLRFERRLPVNEVVFLDRGPPDALAYCRVWGLDPNALLAACFQHRYASVFILDRFPVQQDGMRFEDDAAADFIDEWHARDYSALGYRVVRVPLLSPEERLAFVLETLSQQGGI
jgi:predicted ATPase